LRQWYSSRTKAEDEHIENQSNNQREDYSEGPAKNNDPDDASRKGSVGKRRA
jgi:hypothetical protein